MLPLNLTEPEVGFSRPARTRSNVDLPQPDGPTIATVSDVPSRRLMSDSASVEPVSVPYFFAHLIKNNYIRAGVAHLPPAHIQSLNE